jgi:hypothetical protein
MLNRNNSVGFDSSSLSSVCDFRAPKLSRNSASRLAFGCCAFKVVIVDNYNNIVRNIKILLFHPNKYHVFQRHHNASMLVTRIKMRVKIVKA